jgi:hypothetical protein
MGQIFVVNKRTHKPTDRDVYIGRPTPLGNPYTHQLGTTAEIHVGTREEAVLMYRLWLPKQIIGGNKEVIEALQNIQQMAEHDDDVYLVCWCAPKKCHGEVIRDLILECLKDTK